MSLKAYLSTPRGQFLSTAMTALVPLLVVWWMGAGVMIDLLRPGASWLAGQLDLAQSISSTPTHDWLVETGLDRASGSQVGAVVIPLGVGELRRLLLGFPLFLALILAVLGHLGPVAAAPRQQKRQRAGPRHRQNLARRHDFAPGAAAGAGLASGWP